MKHKEVFGHLEFRKWEFDITNEDNVKEHVLIESFPWYEDKFPLSVRNIEIFESKNPGYKFSFRGVEFSSPNELGKIKWELDNLEKYNGNNFEDAKGPVVTFQDFLDSLNNKAK